MSKEDKIKLDAIEDEAQVNVIEGIKLNGSEIAPVDKVIDLGSIATSESIKTVSDKVTTLETTIGDADSGLVKNVNDNTTKIETNKTDIKNISDDYLKSTDKVQLLTQITALNTSMTSNLSRKVDKATGKSLIDTTLITKLEDIEDGAQVNKIEKIKLNGTEITEIDKVADLGQLATQSDLDNLKNKVGDPKSDTSAATGLFKTVEDEEKRATAAETTLTTEVNKKLNSADLADEVAKLEIKSDKVKVDDKTLTEKLEEINTSIAVIPDKSDKSYVDTELAKKQDKLISGTNIKTINNESILGEGNLEIVGGVTQLDLDNLKSELTDSIDVKVDLPAGALPTEKSAIIMNADGTTGYDTFPDTSNFASLNGNNTFTNDSTLFCGHTTSGLKFSYGYDNPLIDVYLLNSIAVTYGYDSISTSTSKLKFPSNKTGNIVVDTDLSDYQKKSDDTLATTDKTVVGAINENFNSIKGMSGIVAIKQVNTLPSTVEKNTMYYVGTASPYTIILVDSNSKQTNLGTTAISLEEFAKKTDVYAKTETYSQSEINTKLNTKITKPANPTAQSFLMEDSSGNVTAVEKHIYEHIIEATISGGSMCFNTTIRTNSNTQFTAATLADWLMNNGASYTDPDKTGYPINGVVNFSNLATSQPLMRIYAVSDTMVRVEGPKALQKSVAATLSSGTLTLTPSYSTSYGTNYNVANFSKFVDNVRVLL